MKPVFVIAGPETLRVEVNHTPVFQMEAPKPPRKSKHPAQIVIAGHKFTLTPLAEAKSWTDGTQARRLSDEDSEIYRMKLARIRVLEKEAREFIHEAFSRGRLVRIDDCGKVEQ